MIAGHEKLAESIAQEVEIDTKLIETIDKIIDLYKEARKVTAERRSISRMITTAINKGDKDRVKLLVEDWRVASHKVARYRL